MQQSAKANANWGDNIFEEFAYKMISIAQENESQENLSLPVDFIILILRLSACV